ncbi:hypothetical protein L484_005989 [Morus notabilis]|uniref:Uncharacterized protein n=1 Tax=Morus notabilis TaxID=981085 RepID=W9RCC1_9ROSA|nr:hypothetical protein L484_005989 [Morus notabilis]
MSSNGTTTISSSQYSAKDCVGVNWTRPNDENKSNQGNQSYQYNAQSIFSPPDQKQKSNKKKSK